MAWIFRLHFSSIEPKSENVNYSSLIFAETFTLMHQKRKYRGAAWLIFFISSAALAFAIISHWPWLTLIIPFVTTSFVWAMDIM